MIKSGDRPTTRSHTTDEAPPVVPITQRYYAYNTPTSFEKKTSVLDVEGYVPRDAILDIGAGKVMLCKEFAATMDSHAADLDQGVEFITAGGALEVPMGVAKKKVESVLSRGNPHEHRVSLHGIVVNTTTYDALLGVEFMGAVGGCYDTCIEMFRDRQVGPDGLTQSFEISAPCHLSSPPLTVRASFSGLIINGAGLSDVQGTDDDNVSEDDNGGHHNAPH